MKKTQKKLAPTWYSVNQVQNHADLQQLVLDFLC